MIDRIAPTKEPTERSPVMKQRWAELLFMHWEVPAEALAKLLPPELTLDTWEGRAYVGVVPFTMTGVRPVYLPAVPPLSNFHETNVRTYVHHKGKGPGVWFFSLDAANTLAVKVARKFFHLPYFRADMDLKHDTKTYETHYKTTRLWPEPTPAKLSAHYKVNGPVTPAKPDTLEFFFAERYLLYSTDGKQLYSGRVYHTPYPLQNVELYSVEESLIKAAGIERPDAPPAYAHFAKEVTVNIYALEAVTD